MIARSVSISPGLKEKYLGIKFGFLFVENVNVKKNNPNVETLRKQVEEEVRKRDYKFYLEDKNVVSWINQFKNMGLNPKEIMPAQIAMIKRICMGREIPNINTIVDLANIMACKSKLPVGSFDLDKISGNIVLRISKRGEKYLPLFEVTEEEVPEGEIVYADDEKIFSRYSKDCDITKITSDTKNAFFVIDGTKDVSSGEILKYLNGLEILIKEILNARIVRKEIVE